MTTQMTGARRGAILLLSLDEDSAAEVFKYLSSREVENLGSFCFHTTQQWNDQGKTPDGQRLWVKSTLRQAVACH